MKKRSVIHKNHVGTGCFYGKGKWRVEYKKVSDESNDTYEDREYFSFEQLVTDDRRDSVEWNNSPHSNQKKYPGMIRWQVLVANINPTLCKYDKPMLSRFIGERVETSIRRNSIVRVAYEDWWPSNTPIPERPRPNDYKVTAHYLPDEGGKSTDAYIFQGDRLVDKVEKVETCNRVLAEQTEEDVVNYIEQQKKISSFGKYIRDNVVDRAGTAIIQPEKEETEESLVLPLAVEPEEPDDAYKRRPVVSEALRGIADM